MSGAVGESRRLSERADEPAGGVSRRAWREEGDAHDERGLRVAAGEANVDDHGDPAIVKDSLGKHVVNMGETGSRMRSNVRGQTRRPW